MVKKKLNLKEIIYTIAMTIFLSYLSVLPYILFREELKHYHSFFTALAVSISFLGTVKLITVFFCGDKNATNK